MKRLAASFVLLFVLAAPSASHATAAPSPPRTLKEMIHALRLSGGVTLPTGWDGEWSAQDSTYDCTGALLGTDSSVDTLCGGAPVYGDGSFDCTGTADDDAINVTCVYSMQIVPDCQWTLTTHLRATRTGNSFFAVFTILNDYEGTAPECGFFEDSCEQQNSHGTRLGPAPPEYCATPARPASWGELKLLYR